MIKITGRFIIIGNVMFVMASFAGANVMEPYGNSTEYRISLQAHVGAAPLQLAVIPDLVQTLGFNPPDTRYPSEHE